MSFGSKGSKSMMYRGLSMLQSELKVLFLGNYKVKIISFFKFRNSLSIEL